MRDWVQSTEAFDQLLNWLGTNREIGAIKYEAIRKRLIYLFSCRGCHVPEELADETIDRVSRSIGRSDFHYEGDPALYFYGVAKNIHLEWLRRERRAAAEPLDGKEINIVANDGTEPGSEQRHLCLEQCLQKMSLGKREVLLQYYCQEHNAKIEVRKQLAKQTGLGLNALRIHLHRLRQSLRQCVQECATSAETKAVMMH